MKGITAFVLLAISSDFVGAHQRLPQFTDISNNCTIPHTQNGLNSIEGVAYMHWWTGSLIRCATLVVQGIMDETDIPMAYSSTFSYYNADDTHYTDPVQRTMVSLENPNRKSESEHFDYNDNGTFHLQLITDILTYVPEQGYTLLTCPATPGGVPMTISIFLFTRESSAETVDLYKQQVTDQGFDATQLNQVHQGPDCPPISSVF